MANRKENSKIKATLCALLLFCAPFQTVLQSVEASEIPLLTGRLTSPSRGTFLVADPKIGDQNFEKTVVLLLKHDVEGTVGLIINRPTNVPLSQILPKVDMHHQPSAYLYDGGPVARKTLTLLYRTQSPPSNAVPLFSDVYASQAARVLAEQLRISGGKKGFRLYAGYARWGAGQLRREMKRGDWHLVKADVLSLYERPAKRIWQEMFKRSQSFRVDSDREDSESPESIIHPA